LRAAELRCEARSVDPQVEIQIFWHQRSDDPEQRGGIVASHARDNVGAVFVSRIAQILDERFAEFRSRAAWSATISTMTA
jgi:hypothetical protein